MKKIIYTIFLLATIGYRANATTVSITDVNFKSWLTSHYPSCMSGNQLSDGNAVTSATIVDVSHDSISNLNGIELFTSLTELNCSYNKLTSLPTLPSTLINLYCQQNKISNLPSSLPSNLAYLDCSRNLISSLPSSWPSTLTYLNCENNTISSISSLPTNLITLNCNTNSITSLPTMPSSLEYLYCNTNSLTSLPTLPNTLLILDCSNNSLGSLPNNLTALQKLYCSYDQLNSLPSLPNSLDYLDCNNNNLTSLPTLSNILTYLNCSYNNITTLPTLPNTLTYLDCRYNDITCFEIFSSNLVTAKIIGNNFTCIPNYISGLDTSGGFIPICTSGNTNNCAEGRGVNGYVYKDANNNCIKDAGEIVFPNISVKLLDNSNNLLAQTYTQINGYYYFDITTTGTYSVEIATTGVSYAAVCPSSGSSSFTLSSTPLLRTDVNFGIDCSSTFDVGVQSVHTSGLVFPGQTHQVNIVAGDIGSIIGLNCSAGQSGTIQVTVTGPVDYNSVASGALTPSISGNVFTYTITDFGTVNIQTDIALLFTTHTTPDTVNDVCFDVVVTPTNTDINSNNNIYHFCYSVLNSHDPNFKEVTPIKVPAGYNDWFTYTIHFQNTGTAPAINIKLKDTLDAMLNIDRFEVLSSSHYNIVSLVGNVLTFNFPNILLADSTSNEPASKGYIQYRIKAKNGLAPATKINNTASIFFDYNSPIVTNTATSFVNHDTTIAATSCNNYMFNGKTLSASGLYADTLSGISGCDSIITLQLTINISSHDTITTTACKNYTFAGNTLTASGVYYHTLTNAVGCDSIITLILTINNFNASVMQNNNILTATAVGASYQWLNCNSGNSIIVGATNQSYTATANGDYSVIVSMNGCTDTSACLSVKNMSIDRTIDNMNQINVFPNPTTDQVTIQYTEGDVRKMNIYNMMGECMMQGNLKSGTNNIDVSSLAKGVYIIQVIGENYTYQSKLTKE